MKQAAHARSVRDQPNPKAADSAVLAAFARGDFAAVQRLDPSFVAPAANGSMAPAGLFSQSRALWATTIGSGAVLAVAWWYALQAS